MSFTSRLQITPTIFSTYHLSYVSVVVPDLKIDQMEFAGLPKLHQYLTAWIAHELIRSIEGYVLWRTNRLQVVFDSEDKIQALQQLKAARQLLSPLPLKQRAELICRELIYPMMVLLPKRTQNNYTTALNKIVQLEDYARELIDQEHKIPLAENTE